jgi:hypothetical protein
MPIVTPFAKRRPHGTSRCPRRSNFIGAFRVVPGKDADDAEPPGRFDEPSKRVDHSSRRLVFGSIEIPGLKADGVDSALDPIHRLLVAPRRAPAPPAPLVFGDLLHRVTDGEVDRRRTELTRFLEPLRHPVDDVDDGRTAQAERAVRGQEANRAGAEDRDAVSWAHAGELDRVVSGRQGVREQDEVVLVLVPRLPRQAETVRIGERDPDELGLRPAVAAHAGVAVRAAGVPGIDRQARPAVPVNAVVAEAAADVRRYDNAVALPHRHDGGSHFFDNAERLVADHHSRLGAHAPLIEVQIRAAQRRRGQPQQHVRWRTQLSVVDRAHRHLLAPFEHDGPHGLSRSPAAAGCNIRTAGKGRFSCYLPAVVWHPLGRGGPLSLGG